MGRPKILLTRRWPEKVEIKLSEIYDVTFNDTDTALNINDFCEALKKYDAILPTVTDIMPKRFLKLQIYELEYWATMVLGMHILIYQRHNLRGLL